MSIYNNGNIVNGWKFLTPYGATLHDGKTTIYPLPGPDEKWGPWITHPDKRVEADGFDCGPGGYHAMQNIDAQYAPAVSWWIWYVQTYEVYLLGQSSEKFRARRIRLRRVLPWVFHRMIRLGWCAGLSLRQASLHNADLHGANLCGTCLRGANLAGADLAGANLRRADLHNANLEGANLDHAILAYANLERANLLFARLVGADLFGASLYGANLDGANTTGAIRDGALWPSGS